MKMSSVVIGFLKLSLVCIIILTALDSVEAQQMLKMGFYKTTCPAAEQIVRDTVSKAVTANPAMAAGIIRLYFHDCFVRGCDASLLIKTIPGNEVESEQDAGANAGSLRGFEIIDAAKARIEAACPKTVSCADILAFAARDSTNTVGGFSYAIPSGRRDGRVSNIGEVVLPGPDFNLNSLKRAFVAKGMSVGDLVALSGAHSIGRSGCRFVAPRLYAFNGDGTDPSLDPKYAVLMKTKCPKNKISGTTTEFDLVTPNRLDNQYYRNVKQHRVLFSSDQSLLDSAMTARMVANYANNSNAWTRDFAAAMVRLGSVNVLTGTKGEIRNKCGVIN